MNALGFSLAEAMISTALGAVVLGAAMDSFSTYHQHYQAQRTRAELQQDLRGGINILSNELRLAGVAVLAGRPPLSVTAAEEMAFDANVNGVGGWTMVVAAAGQDRVQATAHSGWVRGKRVLICGTQGCEEHILARDGTSGRLVLTEFLARDYAAGSRVEVLNHVRYYMNRRDPANGKLMREVDGGANPIVEHVNVFDLSYLAGDGRLTGSLDDIKLVRLHVETSGADGRGGRIRRTLTQDIRVRAI